MKVISTLLLWLLSLSTAVSAFTQTATPASSKPANSVVLTWSTPMQRANGSLLSPSELVGYQIYYTVEETGESTMIEIDDTRTGRYEFKDLPPGTYYFAVTAVDANGSISELSDMAQTTVD